VYFQVDCDIKEAFGYVVWTDSALREDMKINYLSLSILKDEEEIKTSVRSSDD